jgi:hypothetical protein
LTKHPKANTHARRGEQRAPQISKSGARPGRPAGRAARARARTAEAGAPE